MRIAYVCVDPGVPVFGAKGCSLHVQEILRVFVEQGHEVDLYAVRVGGPPPKWLQNVQVIPVPLHSSDEVADREVALQEVNDTVRKAMATRGRYDLIYERHSIWSYAAVEYGAVQGVPSIVEINAPLIDEQADHRELVNRTAAESSTSRCFRFATILACVSSSVTSYAMRYGARADRVHVTPNGVRTDRFTPSEAGVPRPDGFTIGFVGSLRPWHAVDDLIDAFATLKQRDGLNDSRLLIVGDGPRREALASQIATLPRETAGKIDLVGHVEPAETPAWLRRFDVAVAPYAAGRDCYFSPLKVFEYLSAGLPVVAARTGQLAEIISDNSTGLLYRPGNLNEMVSALERLRDAPDLRGSLGRAARQVAITEHRWEQRVERLITLAVPDTATVPAGGR